MKHYYVGRERLTSRRFCCSSIDSVLLSDSIVYINGLDVSGWNTIFRGVIDSGKVSCLTFCPSLAKVKILMGDEVNETQ
jgi:hypothetical protein